MHYWHHPSSSWSTKYISEIISPRPQRHSDLTHSLFSFDRGLIFTMHPCLLQVTAGFLTWLIFCSAVTLTWSFRSCSSLPPPKHLLDSWSSYDLDPILAMLQCLFQFIVHSPNTSLTWLTACPAMTHLILALLQCMFQFIACSPSTSLTWQSVQLCPGSDLCFASVHVPVYHTQPKHLPDLTHTTSLFSCDLGLILAMLQCMFQFARAQAPPWHIVQLWHWLVHAMLQCLFQATAVQAPPWPDSSSAQLWPWPDPPHVSAPAPGDSCHLEVGGLSRKWASTSPPLLQWLLT